MSENNDISQESKKMLDDITDKLIECSKYTNEKEEFEKNPKKYIIGCCSYKKSQYICSALGELEFLNSNDLEFAVEEMEKSLKEMLLYEAIHVYLSNDGYKKDSAEMSDTLFYDDKDSELKEEGAVEYAIKKVKDSNCKSINKKLETVVENLRKCLKSEENSGNSDSLNRAIMNCCSRNKAQNLLKICGHLYSIEEQHPSAKEGVEDMKDKLKILRIYDAIHMYLSDESIAKDPLQAAQRLSYGFVGLGLQQKELMMKYLISRLEVFKDGN